MREQGYTPCVLKLPSKFASVCQRMLLKLTVEKSSIIYAVDMRLIISVMSARMDNKL